MATCTAEYLKNLITSDWLPISDPPAPIRQDGTVILVDEAEAGRLLGGLCGKSLYNLRREGLPFVRLGTRVLYDPADLALWVAQKKTASNN